MRDLVRGFVSIYYILCKKKNDFWCKKINLPSNIQIDINHEYA